MNDTMIGVDLAKSVFVLHGASMLGEVKFRKKLSRSQFLKFIADQAPAVVVMEACGSAHYWARQVVELGHAVKLIAPQYVRPFVKRQKNEAQNRNLDIAGKLARYPRAPAWCENRSFVTVPLSVIIKHGR